MALPGTRAAGGVRASCGEGVWRPPGGPTPRIPGASEALAAAELELPTACLLYTSPSPRD
eukprot:10222424-Alexandrium_andersonii.AAC.1